jgi:hypothetical protein
VKPSAGPTRGKTRIASSAASAPPKVSPAAPSRPPSRPQQSPSSASPSRRVVPAEPVEDPLLALAELERTATPLPDEPPMAAASPASKPAKRSARSTSKAAPVKAAGERGASAGGLASVLKFRFNFITFALIFLGLLFVVGLLTNGALPMLISLFFLLTGMLTTLVGFIWLIYVSGVEAGLLIFMVTGFIGSVLVTVFRNPRILKRPAIVFACGAVLSILGTILMNIHHADLDDTPHRTRNNTTAAVRVFAQAALRERLSEEFDALVPAPLVATLE